MTPRRDPEAALIDALRARRPDAFERLYAEYSGPIYNLCARILGDREEAKDLTQEVFVKVFDRLPPAEAGPLKLRPWLYRVATNACFNSLRSRRKLDGGGDAALAQAAAPVDEFERARTVALVEQSLGELNERYRTALVLKDLQGLPADEIAEVLEVSRSNADVLVHRARASFRAAFGRLAGDGAPAPASLGLVLAPLGLPAALQALPPLPAGLSSLPDISSAAGPAGAGLLAKIGAALTTKAAIGGAAAALVVGGGVALVGVGGPRAPAGTAGPDASPALTTAPSGHAEGAAHDGAHDRRGPHEPGHDRGTAHDGGHGGAHAGDHGTAAGDAAHDAREAEGTAPATHESSTTSGTHSTQEPTSGTQTSPATHDGDAGGGGDDPEH